MKSMVCGAGRWYCHSVLSSLIRSKSRCQSSGLLIPVLWSHCIHCWYNFMVAGGHESSREDEDAALSLGGRRGRTRPRFDV